MNKPGQDRIIQRQFSSRFAPHWTNTNVNLKTTRLSEIIDQMGTPASIHPRPDLHQTFHSSLLSTKFLHPQPHIRNSYTGSHRHCYSMGHVLLPRHTIPMPPCSPALGPTLRPPVPLLQLSPDAPRCYHQ